MPNKNGTLYIIKDQLYRSIVLVDMMNEDEKAELRLQLEAELARSNEREAVKDMLRAFLKVLEA